MKLCKLLISSVAFLLILSGCGVSPKPTKSEAPTDRTLPIVKLTKNGTFVDINAIAFEWKSIEDERVKGIHVYKQNMNQNLLKKGEKISQLEYYATINSRFTTHFVDGDIKPDSEYKYGFKTFSKEAESKMSRLKVINSLPVLESVIWIRSIQNMPRSAKIIWRPHLNQKVKAYIIERKSKDNIKWMEIARVEGRLNAEFIDTKLKDNFIYRYRVRVLTYDGIISTPSEIVRVVTRPLPETIEEIVTTTNLPKKIELKWTESTTQDFDRYYLYRAEKFDGPYELIAKLYNNKFTNKIDEDGKTYFYRVSAVEKNGLESIYDKFTVSGSTLIKPESPSLLRVKMVGDEIELKWSSEDSRVKEYIVIKKAKTGWFNVKEEKFSGIKTTKFIDSEVVPNAKYYYRIYALDRYSILSKPSVEIEFKVPAKLVAVEEKKEEVKKVSTTPKKSEPIKKSKKKVSSSSKKKTQEVIVPLEEF